MSDKKPQMGERIAAMFGRTSYRDFREGFGGTTPTSLTDQDIAAAVGLVNLRLGITAGMVLETHFGSNLRHLDALLRAWEESQPSTLTRERTVLTRFGGELAIRELASIQYGTPQLSRYAYLICSRREALQERVKDASAWLHEILYAAIPELSKCVRESWETGQARRNAKAA